jgi:hypothetical protein
LVEAVGIGRLMRYVLRLFGVPVVSLTVEQLVEYEETEEAPTVGGGSAHNFERDGSPLSPESRYEWEWEDRRGFGFGATR